MSNNLALAYAPEEHGFLQLADEGTAAVMAEMFGIDMTFDRIKVPSGGGLSFELSEMDMNGQVDAKELNAVILYHHPLQTYYRNEYTGGNEHPDCGSMDGITGAGDPGGDCATCVMNKFGTGKNNSKACKNRHRLYILREGEMFPMILDLPTGSVRGFGQYIKRLINLRKTPGTVVTRFVLQKAVNNGGITYSQVVFNCGRILSDEENEVLSKFSGQFKTYSQSAGYDAEDAGSMPEAPFPNYDPMTGEIDEEQF